MRPASRAGAALIIGATATLVTVSLVVAVAAGPLYRLAERAASDLADGRSYLEAVLGG